MSITSNSSSVPYEQMQLYVHADKIIADRTKELSPEKVQKIEEAVHEKLQEAFEKAETSTDGHVESLVEVEVAKHTSEAS